MFTTGCAEKKMTLALISVIIALTFITITISLLYFEKTLDAWCFATTKFCLRLSSPHNVKE